jgi:HlyD family secretion protein
VYSLVDLSDVYMYVFLPERVAGKIAIGSDARIVLDAAPDYPVTAAVSFVSPLAQFTPRAVETQEERHNLTFRVKLQIPRERLLRYEALVKTGIPAMGYVRFSQNAQWPANLVGGHAPPPNLWAPTGSAPAPVASDREPPNGGSGQSGGRR